MPIVLTGWEVFFLKKNKKMYSVAAPTSRHRMLSPRTLSGSITSTLLPDIAEYSPNLEPTRSPSPSSRRALRSVSVASFLSDGTVEIEGFGFDTISDSGDDASLYETSIYEGSVYNGDEESCSINGDIDLSRRAEKILASAKRKLDLCGQNISRARSSLVLSPSATPTQMMDSLDAVGQMGQNFVRRSESVGGTHSLQWKYNNRQENEDRGPTHLRTASESAVHSRPIGTVAGLGNARSFDELSRLPEGQPLDSDQLKKAGIMRSNSTQQMRVLRDQMKDLRGKITSLQQQARSDSSLRQRRSINSLRSTPGLSDSSYSPSTPSLEDIRESRVLNLKSPDEWEHISPQPGHNRGGDNEDESESRCGTPKPLPRREQIHSPFSEQHEDRTDAFSYDSYLFGNSLINTIRPTSISSDGTVTSNTTAILQPPQPQISRKDSFVSVSSFITANENTRSASQSPQRVSDQETLHVSALRPPSARGNSGSPRDDGYHSAPNTPRVDREQVSENHSPPPPAPSSSWYRDSVDIVEADESSPHVDHHHHHYYHQRGASIESSKRDSQMMVVGGMGVGGKDEIELRVGRGDRVLIEGVIEALGRVCCAMETEEGRGRMELRERLRGAMMVLEGEDPVGEMF